MSLGVIMLCHAGLDRAAQVARAFATGGCPVVVHLDVRVPESEAAPFRAALADLPDVGFSHRHACEWGTWSLVAATQAAARQLLDRHPGIGHVFLASGSCLPLRPVPELRAYLAARPDTDFIESVTVADVGWTIGGLDAERFTLWFPFSWRRQRAWFDRFVDWQRRLGLRRQLPDGLVPHLGSQWWCLTRATLTAILDDPRRAEFDRYFRNCWIPDEGYFQTLARHHAGRLESRSLTLSRFDGHGRPHVFYDDHLQLLRRSDCFVARKIWPGADRLYREFLSEQGSGPARAEPDPGRIERLFTAAVQRRRRGRPGLYMQSRYPRPGHEVALTAGPYSVFQGFDDLFPDFASWIARATGMRMHGHLFAPDRAEFAGNARVAPGCLGDSAALRDYAPRDFLTSLIWNTRGERQGFLYGPRDLPALAGIVSGDRNAQVSVIAGAWLVPLSRALARGADFASIRRSAAQLHRAETAQVDGFRAHGAVAQLHLWPLADFLSAPDLALRDIVHEVGARSPGAVADPPRMVSLAALGKLVRALRDDGLPTPLAGSFAADACETGRETKGDHHPTLRARRAAS